MTLIKLFILLIFLSFCKTFAKNYIIDSNESYIKWYGEKITAKHWGFVDLKSGYIKVDDNKIVGGEFTTNMTTISVQDIEPGETNDNFITHLKSEDFFNTSKFPEAKFKLKKVKEISKNKIKVTGDLTIKGIKKEVSFFSTYSINENILNAKAKLVIDRTKFNITFWSSSFFNSLGDKVIYDDFTLSIKIVAKIQ